MSTRHVFGGATTRGDSFASVGSWLAVAAVCSAICIAPLSLGATNAWPRFAVEATLACAAIAWCVFCRPTMAGALAPCGALAIAAVQLMPLSATFATAIAPISAGAWLVANAETGSAGLCISMDPAATVLAASRLFLGLAAMLAIAALSRHKPARKAFFLAMVATGVVMWVLGIAFPARGHSRMPLGMVSLAGPITDWLDPRLAPVQTSGCSWGETIEVGSARYVGDSGTPGDGCGSYISSNQFAGGMCLTLPFVLAGWMALTRNRAPAVVRHLVLLLLLTAAVATTAILAQSRAGSAALLLAGLGVWMLSAQAPWLKWTTRALVAGYTTLLIAFALILYSGRGDLVQALPEPLGSRLAAAASDSRGLATRVAAKMFSASPVAGVGLGCFEPVFSRLVPGLNRLHYAHNDYAQYLAETGLVGAMYAAAFGWGVLRRKRRAQASGAEEWGPSHIAAWAAVAGIAAHSGFDWNLHLPANSLLAIVAAGLDLPAERLSAADRVAASKKAWLVRGLVVALALLICGLLFRDAVSETAQRRLRDAIVADRLHRKDPARPNAAATLDAAITSAESVARFDAGNSRLAVAIGQATLHAAAAAPEGAARERLRSSADSWFREAHVRRAFCTGLPE